MIRDKVKEFILREFLPGEDPSALTESTELMTTGILDSLATLKLVTYLEEEFGIQVDAHEADAENLNTLADIVRLVTSKQG
jgi:acyl carrier protein